MIDLDDVLAHAHDNCVACEGTGVVRCWSPGGPCPDGQTVCESCGPCQQSDVPALVAALREARSDRAKATTWHMEALDDLAACVAERDEARAEVEARKEAASLADSLRGDAQTMGSLTAERDDWRRRYEALRDGVTGLCYDPDPDTDDGMTLISVDAIRAVVARVEGDES